MRVLLLTLAIASLFSSGTANAEVLAVCGKLETLGAATYGVAAMQRMSETQAPETATPRSQIALWRDAKGFDVLLNWGERNQLSLRSEGAEIMGNEIGDDLIHLVVARSGKQSLEHFLFVLDDHAVGELIWNGSSDTRGNANDDVVDQTACIKPKH